MSAQNKEIKLFAKRPLFLPCRSCLILAVVIGVFGLPVAFLVGYASILLKDANYLLGGLFAVLGAIGVLSILIAAFRHFANHVQHNSNTHPDQWLCKCSKDDALARILAYFLEVTETDEGNSSWAPEQDDYFKKQNAEFFITAKRKFEATTSDRSGTPEKSITEVAFRARLADSNGEGSPCSITCTFASIPGNGYTLMHEAHSEIQRLLGSAQ